jgi:hypothetical protein
MVKPLPREQQARPDDLCIIAVLRGMRARTLREFHPEVGICRNSVEFRFNL